MEVTRDRLFRIDRGHSWLQHVIAGATRTVAGATPRRGFGYLGKRLQAKCRRNRVLGSGVRELIFQDCQIVLNPKHQNL